MTVTVLTGDCRDVLKDLPGESVHCVVTSPPYLGLRDYGIPPSVWGGDAGCEHEWGKTIISKANDSNRGDMEWMTGGNPGAKVKSERVSQGAFCRCGAWRGAFGLEPTYQLYVEHAVEIFREVRRVLRKDGTVFLNLGDSYISQGGQRSYGSYDGITGSAYQDYTTAALKPKDLCGIPWRVAFALQADGWWLRQDIIWSKSNPMPESVTDRCTKGHEYLFLLSKSAQYYYDAEAIKEDVAPSQVGRVRSEEHRTKAGLLKKADTAYASRNKRSVWEIATAPFSEAHFATFPPALVEPCILAGCPKGGTVLDPFGGAGTTGMVADRLGRNAILIELNPDYAAMAERRIRDDAGMFADVGMS